MWTTWPSLLVAASGDGFVLRAPTPDGPVLLASSVAWPKAGPVACDVLRAWPRDAVVQREEAVIDVRRHGPVVDIVLDRHSQAWCQLVVGPGAVDERGSFDLAAEEKVWWQDAAGIAAARPRQRMATARERGVDHLEVVVDTREQVPWTFAAFPTSVVSDKLDVGDYAVLLDGVPVGVVERKKRSDYQGGLMTGRALHQLAALARLPRAAVVVEGSYAQSLRSTRITRPRMADLIATTQASYPSVATVYAGNRAAAEEWTWHFLAAAFAHALAERAPFPTTDRALDAPDGR